VSQLLADLLTLFEIADRQLQEPGPLRMDEIADRLEEIRRRAQESIAILESTDLES
jgi:hypothetical protein